MSRLSFIFYDRDFDEPDPNSFSSVSFVDFQGKSLVKHQSVIVPSGLHETSVMRSVARAPALIQLKSEEKLTRVERVARFWGGRFVLNGGKSCAGHPLNSIAGCVGTIIPFITSFKPDKPAAVWHAISDVAVWYVSNANIMCDRDLNSQRGGNFQDASRNHGNFEKSGMIYCACVECQLLGGWRTRTADVWRMRFQPSRSHCLMVNHFSLYRK